MNLSFWLGLLVSIPIGIAVNLIAPRVERRMILRNERRSARSAKQQQDMAATVDWFSAHPSLLTLYVVRAYMDGVYSVGMAVVGVCTVFLFSLPDYNNAAFQRALANLGFVLIFVGMFSFWRRITLIERLWDQVRKNSNWPIRADLSWAESPNDGTNQNDPPIQTRSDKSDGGVRIAEVGPEDGSL